MVQKIGRGGNEGGEGKEEKEEEEEEEKEEDEEEEEEDEEEDKKDEEDEQAEEDEAKRTEEGRGGGGGESVENLVRGDSFKAKAEAKPKQSKIHKTRRQAGGFITITFLYNYNFNMVLHGFTYLQQRYPISSLSVTFQRHWAQRNRGWQCSDCCWWSAGVCRLCGRSGTDIRRHLCVVKLYGFCVVKLHASDT